MKDLSRVPITLREENTSINIHITDIDKPEIPRGILSRWQRSVESLSILLQIPVAFITQLSADTIEVIVASKSGFEVFQIGSKLALHRSGTFCEQTIGGKAKPFVVLDAKASPIWNSAFIKTGVQAYVGYPIHWPDGQAFGSLCVAYDRSVSQEEIEKAPFLDILQDYQLLIERDLEALLASKAIAQLQDEAKVRLQEVSHRAKNHFAILSNLIQLTTLKPDLDIKQTLLDIDAKIRTMALLHEMLYESVTVSVQNASSESISYFLRAVLETTLQLANFPHSLDTQLDGFPALNEKYLFDLSLVFSELVTNAIKNFSRRPIKDTLKIGVWYRILDQEAFEVQIIFRDNGPGFSEDFLNDTSRYEGIGYTMVRNFVRVMGGSFRVYNDNGAVIEMSLRL